jgi:hypothetical protein
VAAVLVMVSVAVPVAVLLMLAGVVEPKLKVGGSNAAAGPLVISAVKFTLPVKPPLGVTVIVDVLPLVDPGTTVTAVPLTV